MSERWCFIPSDAEDAIRYSMTCFMTLTFPLCAERQPTCARDERLQEGSESWPR